MSMELIKELRQRTGAGVADCKSALTEANGDVERAIEVIQKKGLIRAAKRASAVATDGVVHAYVHPGSRLGVLVEVNCQTDFVARNEEFRDFADIVGLQIASMGAQYVRRDDVTLAEIAKQEEIIRAQIALDGKSRTPESISKILLGKLGKWFAEVCLMEQIAVTDGNKTLQQLADELTAKLGEKVSVRRFARFELGEGLAKVTTNLADEVAEVLGGV